MIGTTGRERGFWTEHHFNGKVEAPRVYDRALSLGELTRLSTGDGDEP